MNAVFICNMQAQSKTNTIFSMFPYSILPSINYTPPLPARTSFWSQPLDSDALGFLCFQALPVLVTVPAAFLPRLHQKVTLISHCLKAHTGSAASNTAPFPSSPASNSVRVRAGFQGRLLIAEIVIPSTRYLAAPSLPAQPLNVHTFEQ